MPRLTFVQRTFKRSTLVLIDRANEILEEYAEQGMVMNLRQLHYQFVSRDLYANTTVNYNRLKNAMNDGRWAGLVDWSCLEDQTRYVRKLPTWNSPRQIMESAAQSFRTDKWIDQKIQPEVWFEKDALLGVIGPVCDEFEVPYFSTRGYPSLSGLWDARLRMRRYARCVILYLGDHDPSGLHITEDLGSRLAQMGFRGNVERLALTTEQINQYNPPPNPAKRSDSRYDMYVEQTGLDESWELDSLEPRILQNIIRDRILDIRDDEVWEDSRERQEVGRDELLRVTRNWDAVLRFLEECEDA